LQKAERAYLSEPGARRLREEAEGLLEVLHVDVDHAQPFRDGVADGEACVDVPVPTEASAPLDSGLLDELLREFEPGSDLVLRRRLLQELDEGRLDQGVVLDEPSRGELVPLRQLHLAFRSAEKVDFAPWPRLDGSYEIDEVDYVASAHARLLFMLIVH